MCLDNQTIYRITDRTRLSEDLSLASMLCMFICISRNFVELARAESTPGKQANARKMYSVQMKDFTSC